MLFLFSFCSDKILVVLITIMSCFCKGKDSVDAMMMRSLFRGHGEFCASHPLEVVVATVTIISSLVSMGSTVQVDRDKVCGWNYECAKAQVYTV